MSKKQVLICDDNQDLLQILSMSLNQLPQVQVVSLSNGKGIMKYLDQTHNIPDLLIVDLMLPDLEGDDVIILLRKKKKFAQLPIILMSGVIYNIENRAKAVGANDFLLKPFSIKDLKEKVANYLTD